jgi:hypothetical protein
VIWRTTALNGLAAIVYADDTMTTDSAEIRNHHRRRNSRSRFKKQGQCWVVSPGLSRPISSEEFPALSRENDRIEVSLAEYLAIQTSVAGVEL